MKLLPICFTVLFLSCSVSFLSGCDDPIATTIKEYKIDWPETLTCTGYERGPRDPSEPLAHNADGTHKKVKELDKYSCFSQTDVSRIEAEVLRLRRELGQCQSAKTILGE